MPKLLILVLTLGLVGMEQQSCIPEPPGGGAGMFTEVDDFEDLDLGELPGQAGWELSPIVVDEVTPPTEPEPSGSLSVTTDPQDPDNRVGNIVGDIGGFVASEAIEEGTTGTLFYRMYRRGEVDAFAGTSPTDVPFEFADFEAQVGARTPASSNFRIRNGAEFEEVGVDQLLDETWYCVWVVADNAADIYEVHVQGGEFENPTQLNSSTGDWNFRNGTTDDLNRFYLRASDGSIGDFMVDDIFVDPSGSNLDIPQGECPLSLPPVEPGISAISDPIPETIEPDGTTVQAVPIATVPQSQNEEGEPLTRINYLYHPKDGTDRLFVNDLNGQLHVIDGDNNVTTYLDVAAEFPEFKADESLNAGVSTFTFHPDFESNGIFYTAHTENPGDVFDFDHPNAEIGGSRAQSVIIEWTAANPTADTFSGTNRELFRSVQNTVKHGVQLVEFNRSAEKGSDDYGMLYVSVGDGEGEDDVEMPFTDVAQNLEFPQGKILRINPNLDDERGTISVNGQYRIPDDNPFVGLADGSLGEIWAYGFRNPIRFDFDPATGMMLATNTGERNIEEVELVEPGNNYGWNEREGTFTFDPSDRENVFPLPDDDDPNLTYPVAQYDHDEGFAIIGGFVYRGSAIPSLFGSYVFGDIVQGGLFHVKVDNLVRGEQATIHALTLLDENGDETAFNDLISAERADLRFGLDADGEIYIMSKQDGVVRQLVAAE